jgi:hypothetical protein
MGMDMNNSIPKGLSKRRRNVDLVHRCGNLRPTKNLPVGRYQVEEYTFLNKIGMQIIYEMAKVRFELTT